MENEPDDAERTRPPLMADLVDLCRELNLRNARYIVIGGMAINIHGFARNTEDIDLLIETEDSNESKVLEVLALYGKPSKLTAKKTPWTVHSFAGCWKTAASGRWCDAGDADVLNVASAPE
jgi:hypothetical protein